LAGAEESVFVRAASPSMGAESAIVQVVEFYVKSLMRANDGKLRLTLRYATFHEGSDYVVKVLEAARMQGPDMYWKSLEAILANQATWPSTGVQIPSWFGTTLVASGWISKRPNRT